MAAQCVLGLLVRQSTAARRLRSARQVILGHGAHSAVLVIRQVPEDAARESRRGMAERPDRQVQPRNVVREGRGQRPGVLVRDLLEHADKIVDPCPDAIRVQAAVPARDRLQDRLDRSTSHPREPALRDAGGDAVQDLSNEVSDLEFAVDHGLSPY
jgi:hypothetical protein